MTLFIHIGTHKTGSSSVQRFFSQNADTLLSRFGVLYPVSGRNTIGSHHHLVYEIKNDPRFHPGRGGWDALKQELAAQDCAHVFLSCEALSAYRETGDIIARFAELGAHLEMPVVPILVARPQAPYLEALYVENIKSGGTPGAFGDFVERYLDHPRLDYHAVAESWSQPFGKTRVLPYLKHQGFDSVAAVSAAAGIDPQVLFDYAGVPQRVNERVGRETLQILYAGALAARDMRFSRAEIRKLMARIKNTLVPMGQDAPAKFLDRATAEEIAAHFRESNRKLSEQYLDGQAFDEAPPAAEAPGFDAGTIEKLQAALTLTMKAQRHRDAGRS